MKKNALIVGRMESTRFPGKMLAPLLGKPLTYWIITEFLKRDYRIIYATTFKAEDDILAEYAESIGAEVYRGEEKDVFKRTFDAIKHFNLDHIVENSGDCPFRLPSFTDDYYPFYERYGNEFHEYHWDLDIRKKIGEALSALRTFPYFEMVEKAMNRARKEVIEEIEGSYGVELAIAPYVNNHLRSFNCGKPERFNILSSPPKLSIDYPCELDMWNRVLNQYGKFPSDSIELFEAVNNFKIYQPEHSIR